MRQIYKKWKISPYFFSIKLLRKLRSFGLFQIGISVGALILSMFDRYMIEAFKGTEQVGIYSAGYNIASMSIQAPLSILMLAALPIIVHTFEASGEHDTKLLFKKVFSLYFIILVPAVFGIAALSKEIVSIMLGQPFVSAAIILAWIAGASFFFGISQYLSIPYQLKEKLHVLFYLIIAGGIMNIILNFILIPPLGILGAAYATLIAYFIYCVASYLAIREIMALSFPWIVLAKSLVASTIMYLTLNYISELLAHNITSFISEVSIGVVVYFLTLMLLKERTFLNGVQPFVNAMRNILKIRLR